MSKPLEQCMGHSKCQINVDYYYKVTVKSPLMQHGGRVKREGGYCILAITQAKIFSQKEKNTG